MSTAASSARRRLPPGSYTVAWVCALPLELQAARAMLDEEHQDPPCEPHETNVYCLGRIGHHNVVVVCLPAGRYGTNSAAACAAEMMQKFCCINFGVMVGIGGGVPSTEADVRLGDVVISQPRGQHGGVVQYDLRKIEAGGKARRTGYLCPPPTMLLNALAKFQALQTYQSNNISAHLAPATAHEPDLDILYESSYDHVGGATCEECDLTRVQKRKERSQGPQVHYGVIASGNQVVKDGVTRDRLNQELEGVLCFEMEAPGLLNTLPCLVFRGICDYCDSHKNKQWQKYAAAVAAAYAKEFFDVAPTEQISIPEAAVGTNARFEAMFLTDPLIDRASLISAKGERVKGTCEWIHENAVFKSWLVQHGEPLLWICGGPGKGKTMLSIYLTEELDTSPGTLWRGSNLIFYFCTHENDKRNTATAILRSLIYQIITKKPALLGTVQNSFETQQKTDYTLSSPEVLWAVFQTLTSNPELGFFVCVLDGLDECDTESIKFFAAKVSRHFTNNDNPCPAPGFRLVVVSREINLLKGLPTIQLDPDYDEQVHGDIQRFVYEKVQELYKINGFNTDLADHVTNTLLERSEGTFLWVGLVMNELLQKTTCTELLNSLETLPNGLPGIYRRILSRIGQRQHETCALILLWVTLAMRPLTVDQLTGVMVPPTPGTLNRHQVMIDKLTLLKPLIRVNGDEISLIHQSLRDYLVRDRPEESPVLELFRVRPEEGHSKIVQACLNVIENSSLKELTIPSFSNYAGRFWTSHVQHAGAYGDAIFDTSRPMFKKDTGVAGNWFKAFGTTDDNEKLSRLHMASACGVTPWVRKLLARKRGRFILHRYVNKKDYEGNTPLHHSILGGHDATTQVLLENGADVNANKGKKFPLLATKFGPRSVWHLFPRDGPVIDGKLEFGETPLIAAIDYGNLKLAQQLIAYGADVNQICPGYNSDAALKTALWGGWFPLSIAISSGYKDMVEILLRHGANPNVLDKFDNTPLGHAVERGEEWSVPLLITYGADINLANSYMETPLIRVAIRGIIPGVKMLLDHGADIHKKCKAGRTAVDSAAFEGRRAVVQMICEHERKQSMLESTLRES